MLAATQAADLVSRLRRTVSNIDLDSQSRDALERAFDRFAALERRREVRSAIATARAQKEQIVLFLGLLAELDELTDQERDRSAFEEIAVLFSAIARCATEGAAAMVSIGPHASENDRRDVERRSSIESMTQRQRCTICHLGGTG